MAAKTPNLSWNEIQFLSWSEFQQMAPSILQLEITRIGKVIRSFPADTDFHNGLVRARFELKQFVACLGQAEKDSFGETCAPHLRKAIMSMSVQPPGLDLQTREKCAYVLDRLNYINHRISLIY